MRGNDWQQVDTAVRLITPTLLIIILVVVSQIPLQIPNAGPVFPDIVLIAVYYWAVHRPDLMPFWVVFLIGLLQDLLGGDALGVSSMIYLAVFWTVAAQQRFFMSRSFGVIWAGFIVIGAGVVVLSWGLHALILGRQVQIGPALFQYLTTIAAYPLLAWIFAQTQRLVLK
ncbi:MAG: rod shape-determining protein MreD [Kiloniellales bacterium]|nr:rod shape-determining protein MreD [Kiloniellales bacterium]MDJ0972153.1 rod shape-determining protein MreD [Kiloniellales bacterium]MDJ0981278.1 rod shape-determining protein MreD [Kiloniellales bacterium]